MGSSRGFAGIGALLALCCGALAARAARAPAPWDADNFSPTTRTLHPVRVWRGQNATTMPPDGGAAAAVAHGSTSPLPITLHGDGAYVVLDFGKEVGGFLSLGFGAVTGSAAVSLGIAFSESTNYASCPSDSVNTDCGQYGRAPGDQRGAGDHSNGGHGPDGTLSTGPLAPGGAFAVAAQHLRGGFRYLNLFLEQAAGSGAAVAVEITRVQLNFTAQPGIGPDPSRYANHFHSSNATLNRVWYACAYTVQLCSVPAAHGRAWPPPSSGWDNAVEIGPVPAATTAALQTVLVDGAKRDRTIWPGDLGISAATAFATTGDPGDAAINGLRTLYALQDPKTGQLPYVGPAVFCQAPAGQPCATGGAYQSDTYHLWALKATGDVYRSGPAGRAWFASTGVRARHARAVNASLAKVAPADGLMHVDALADWQRQGQGGANVAANALLYKVLDDAAALARAAGDATGAARYAALRAALGAAIDAALWDAAAGAYRDNPTSTLHPQDGNALAAWFGVAARAGGAAGRARVASVLRVLRGRWAARGAVSPEWLYEGRAAIGTFPGSMEVHAHLANGAAADAAELVARQWGYMLDCPNSTGSTFWEGFQADGQYAFTGVYMSHAHGWATGPAGALSAYALGLRPADLSEGGGGGGYVVAPAPSASMRWCNGSRAFGADGRVEVAWHDHAASGDGLDGGGDDRLLFSLTVDARGYAGGGGAGRVGLPLRGRAPGAVHVVAADGGGGGLTEVGVDEDGERLWFELEGGRRVTLEMHG